MTELMKITVPNKTNADVVEFLGILTGDGCINKYTRMSTKKRVDYYISIAGSATEDKEYFDQFVIPLTQKLFCVRAKYYKKKGQNTIELMLRYRLLFDFLTKIGFNIGPKDDIDIPKYVVRDPKLSLRFLRGLFDTDGSISWKKHRTYPVISINQKSRKLIESVCDVLNSNGLSFHAEFDVKTIDRRGFTSVCSRIYVSGKKNLNKWLQLIGSNHPIKMRKLMGGEGIPLSKPQLQ
jgi:intein/homing endonuclease